MRAKHKNKHAVAKAIVFLIVLIGSLSFYIAYFLHGHNAAQLEPKGTIAVEQSHLGYVAAAIVLAVAVPTLTLLYYFAWKYRESNTNSTYHHAAHHGKFFVFFIWALPTWVMLMMAMILVPVTRHLDPKTQLENGSAPMTIQVIALRWKWLFLYPQQQIATVNTLVIPKDQPVEFYLTADDAPMSSFWIPNLGGQLYAMTGHVNHLNLVGSQIGDYPGSSAEINGAGFADMKFVAHVTSQKDFDAWVSNAELSPTRLDRSTYSNLVKPTEAVPPTTYSSYADDLYNTILMKYMGPGSSHMSHMEGM